MELFSALSGSKVRRTGAIYPPYSRGQADKLFKKIAKLDVLVIDDFLLTPTTQDEQKYLMEVFELRSRDSSLIISSQMETGEWHKKLGGGAIADAILDRAISNSYHLYISGDSLRMKAGSVASD